RDRAGINEPLNARSPRGFEQILRAGYVGLVNLAGIARPKAVIRSHVEDARHTLEGPVQRSRVPQISGETFRLESFEGARVARRAHQDANIFTAFGELAGDVTPEEACRSCDQRFHSTRKVPSGDTKSRFGGGGFIVVPPPVWPLVGLFPAFLPGLPPIRPDNCHFSMVQVSPS